MTTDIVTITRSSPSVCREADTDGRLVELWLHGRPVTTRRVYTSDVNCFLTGVKKPLRDVTLGDLQSFADQIEARSLKPATRHRMLASVKSLISFGCKLGYLTFDVAKPLRLPSLKDTLAERILSEAEIQQMLVIERQPRNKALLYLLYTTGVRVSEVCGLKWRDLQDGREGGQVTVFGKGGKTNTILIPSSVWTVITSVRGDAHDDTPVFRSRRGGHLHPSQVFRIVKGVAKRTGITKNVSPHWLRHGHASHALDRGAPIHLVQATLGHASISTTGRYLHARPTDSSSKYLGL